MSEAIALSLANAELGSPGDLDRWLRRCEQTAELAGELSLRLPEFLDLRACIRELLGSVTEGRPMPADAVGRLNEASSRVPRVALLRETDVIQVPVGASPAPLALAHMAWSAIDVLGGPDRVRLRRCGACGRFFVAGRADRVWCSDRCGNRIRVARHHARLRSHSYPVRG